MREATILNQRFQLLEPLGAGGMATVYKAQDMALGRPVAVKVLREAYTSDAAFLSRFQQEARAAASLTHPNIVTVHDFGQDGGQYFIVMEYVEGDDLKAILRRGGALPLERAIDLSIQICAGVGHAHRAGLVHCDLKSQNVLVTADGQAKVTDFGIARALAGIQPGEKAEVVWGSPQYFSPEQAAGDAPTPASDVYSIGVILYEMLAGRLPFQAKSHQALALMHQREEPRPLSLYNPAVPDTVERIVRKVLSKEPSARYRTADQLGRILVSYREQGYEATTAGPAVRAPAGPTATARPAASAEAAQPAGVDWLAIVLGIMAFLAVAGLFPLWLLVYLQYRQPAPTQLPSLPDPLFGAIPVLISHLSHRFGQGRLV